MEQNLQTARFMRLAASHGSFRSLFDNMSRVSNTACLLAWTVILIMERTNHLHIIIRQAVVAYKFLNCRKVMSFCNFIFKKKKEKKRNLAMVISIDLQY